MIIYHSDVHGSISGLVALKSLMNKGYKVLHHFSNFDKSPPATEPEPFPCTLKMLVEQYIIEQYKVQQFKLQKVYILDIPIDVRNPSKAVWVLEEVSRCVNVEYIDHHEVPPEASNLVIRGILRLYKSAYKMTLHIPKELGVLNSELEYLALIGATADGDSTVADMVPRELEYVVNTYVDSAWKVGFRTIDEVKNLMPKYGNAGAVVHYMLERNIGYDELLELAEKYGKELKPVDYEVRGNVVVAKEVPPEGFGWKMSWLLSWLTGAPIAVVKHISRGKMTVIVATYWRRADLKLVVDEAVFSVVADKTRVVGHPGARSILVSDSSEADEIARRIAEKINERLSAESYGVASVSA